jgi:hypothetical protein
LDDILETDEEARDLVHARLKVVGF